MVIWLDAVSMSQSGPTAGSCVFIRGMRNDELAFGCRPRHLDAEGACRKWQRIVPAAPEKPDQQSVVPLFRNGLPYTYTAIFHFFFFFFFFSAGYIFRRPAVLCSGSGEEAAVCLDNHLSIERLCREWGSGIVEDSLPDVRV